ncbi:MAG: PLP-dependent transferase [Spirochaetaceae bacterium]
MGTGTGAHDGDTRTIATHPSTTTHSKLTEEGRLRIGTSPGTARVSVGLESTDDIFADIDRALEAARRATRW